MCFSKPGSADVKLAADWLNHTMGAHTTDARKKIRQGLGRMVNRLRWMSPTHS